MSSTKNILTYQPHTITTTTFKTGGYSIVSDVAIVEKGVVYGTTANPTVTKVVDGTTNTSPFNSDITGLTSNTVYYVRAYFEHGVGLFVYGNEWSIVTSSTDNVDECVNMTITLQPGQSYVLPKGAELIGTSNSSDLVSQCMEIPQDELTYPSDDCETVDIEVINDTTGIYYISNIIPSFGITFPVLPGGSSAGSICAYSGNLVVFVNKCHSKLRAELSINGVITNVNCFNNKFTFTGITIPTGATVIITLKTIS